MLKKKPKNSKPKLRLKQEEVKKKKIKENKANLTKKETPKRVRKKKVVKEDKGINVSKKAIKNVSKFRFLTFKMYVYKVTNFLLKGKSDKPNPNLNADDVQIGYRDVFTLQGVTRHYFLTYLPEEAPVALMTYLIDIIKKEGLGAKVSMKIKTSPYTVDLNSNQIMGRFDTWSRREKKLREDEDYDPQGNREKAIKKIRRLLRSYVIIAKNRKNVKTSTVILKVKTDEVEQMRQIHSTIESELSMKDIGIQVTQGRLLDFLKAYTFASQRKNLTTESAPKMLLTARNMAYMSPYNQGKIGSKGIWFGMDKKSGGPVWLDIFKSPLAKNILVMARTGHGKSFFVSMLVFFFNAFKYNIFIDDHKGNEFISFTQSTKGKIISMTPTKSVFINTYKIPYREAQNESEAFALYEECRQIAKLEFICLTDPEAHDRREYEKIFDSFYAHLHKYKDISKSKISSYPNSDDIDPEFLFEMYYKWHQSPNLRKEFNEKHLRDIGKELYKYWHKEGERSELYKEEVTIEEICQSRVVTFAFGMNETTEGTVPPNELKLKKIFKAYAQTRYNQRNKARKEVTINVHEEIQSNDEDLLEFQAEAAAKGRSQNAVNIFVGNSLSSLRTGSKHAQTILDNLTIHLIGDVSKDARKFCMEEFELEKMEKELTSLTTDSDYRRVFLLNCTISDPPVTTLVHMPTSDRVAESVYFKTVDIEEKEGVS